MNDQADSFVVAIATSDGDSIPKTHFGEAAQYEIYRISAASAQKLESIANPHATDGHDGSHHHHFQPCSFHTPIRTPEAMF